MSILSIMTQNISLEEYLALLERMKQAALCDMDTFPEKENRSGDERVFSFLGVRFRYRDDEDCLYADCSSMGYQPFTRFHPHLWEYMKEESEGFLEDQDLFEEPMEDKFYWEVTKYIQLDERIYEQYEVTFSLKLEMLSVKGYLYEFERWRFRHSEYLKYFTEEQEFILKHARQSETPVNVVLPYHPGDILYLDARPFGRPFYAVYCGETMSDRDHFEWTKKEYGFYKREHPCLYISEDHKGLDLTNLAGWFTDYVPFPYAPLDRIRVADTCGNPGLLKASKMLKKDPDVFWKWRDLKWSGAPAGDNGGMEKYIF
ncbi:MAG: hypothetical protein KHY08_13950 [Lachnospiraceae bacterium]|nr:hypothetical protein [Lachnospiraceae bacterium]